MKLNKKSINKKKTLQITIVIITLLVPSLAFGFTQINSDTLNNNENSLVLKISANSESGYTVALKQYVTTFWFLSQRIIWFNFEEHLAETLILTGDIGIHTAGESIIAAIFASCGILLH